MVRAFHTQGFPGSLTTNTNYPPQNSDESASGPVGDFGLELIDEPSPANTGILQFDATLVTPLDTGNVAFDASGGILAPPMLYEDLNVMKYEDTVEMGYEG